MAQTREGGRKAAITNKARHGKDYYRRIGKLGGRRSTGGGFAHAAKNGLDWHVEAGRKGGTISRRGKKEQINEPRNY